MSQEVVENLKEGKNGNNSETPGKEFNEKGSAGQNGSEAAEDPKKLVVEKALKSRNGSKKVGRVKKPPRKPGLPTRPGSRRTKKARVRTKDQERQTIQNLEDSVERESRGTEKRNQSRQEHKELNRVVDQATKPPKSPNKVKKAKKWVNQFRVKNAERRPLLRESDQKTTYSYLKDFKDHVSRIKIKAHREISLEKISSIITQFNSFPTLKQFAEYMLIETQKSENMNFLKMAELYIFSLILQQLSLDVTKSDSSRLKDGSSYLQEMEKLTKKLIKFFSQHYFILDSDVLDKNLADLYILIRGYCGQKEQLFGIIDELYDQLFEVVSRGLGGFYAQETSLYCIRTLYKLEMENRDDESVKKILEKIEENFWKVSKVRLH